MHIVVCIKQVPDSAQIRVHPVTNTIMRQGVPTIINPYDLFALEEALRLKDTLGAEVTVLTMGPPTAAESLRKALTFGADDVDGTVVEETIYHMAGAGTDQSLSRPELERIIREAGYRPVERDTLYRPLERRQPVPA